MSKISPQRGTLSAIIRSIKSAATKRIRETIDPTFTWQYSYHDHIIRDHANYDKIARYIAENPARWEADEYFMSH